MTESARSDCSNCGAPLTGRWCSSCGQKVIEDRDRRFVHVLGQFAHELFHVNGKLPRTLGSLLIRPGQLSRAYLDGQRVRYISPIALFLIINLVYFLAPPMTDFNLGLDEQYHMQPYSSLAQVMVDQRLEHRQLTLAEYATTYNSRNLNLAKSLIVVHLPFLALALSLLVPRRELYLAEHFIVATHLFTFILVISLIMVLGGRIAYLLAESLLPAGWGNNLFVIWRMVPLAIVAHWLLSIREAYTLGWGRSALITLAMVLALVVTHFIFRLIQFMIVFAVT